MKRGPRIFAQTVHPQGRTIELSSVHEEWTQATAAQINRLAGLYASVQMGGIQANATLDECVRWLVEGRTIEEQRGETSKVVDS